MRSLPPMRRSGRCRRVRLRPRSRKTCPMVARSRFAVSSLPRDSTVRRTARISGAVISLIGRLPRAGKARLKSHSVLPTVNPALPSRRFFSTSSAAIAAKVFSAALRLLDLGLLLGFGRIERRLPEAVWRFLERPARPSIRRSDRRRSPAASGRLRSGRRDASAWRRQASPRVGGRRHRTVC